MKKSIFCKAKALPYNILPILFVFCFLFLTSHCFGENPATVLSTQMFPAGNDNSYFGGIDLDDTGNFCVAGCFFNGADNDFLTVKYNSNGETLWQKIYDSGFDDIYIDAAMDSAGAASMYQEQSITATFFLLNMIQTEI
ncbi:hypothetical protein COY52_10665 [Candidatus Desantisbacteria bacterium CG_4_10_14_0_8_um_filter_48_22]|uniref:Uncharacterized protein n=1 Tax=Candidatus Desantisbacteria bacterium CG_4_10_14_0_8_um_filter_48_22 TaxID=1974543 RepID=A0A2M7S5Z4_9BACT|nr:MAG: hypothetical protein AUJ67_07555 [Candidatus Desantisbacteria bacterium CG1_02_49_89]PIV54397.1 MAG: hypothetical protein COS16_10480 [Candidatus Desantisbacteria bacterium CG02_land_8_20_14_3_00_49_13]PIZ14936.1 MAG: hypothetical protein COY52_10665 [Candidatus Desantisbacteria bacterium CG_4_10_14_0_8_um_filter_48_22]PJB27632.1 MAG: hypothetical protein CO111_04275 [Candidatus Desantisbacteria bacterium CG_4_9_14_3_um_filter_50_7]